MSAVLAVAGLPAVLVGLSLGLLAPWFRAPVAQALTCACACDCPPLPWAWAGGLAFGGAAIGACGACALACASGPHGAVSRSSVSAVEGSARDKPPRNAVDVVRAFGVRR